MKVFASNLFVLTLFIIGYFVVNASTERVKMNPIHKPSRELDWNNYETLKKHFKVILKCRFV